MISFINGKFKNNLSVSDRSIHFGDGCFTTIRVVSGKSIYLDDHIIRLKKCIKKLFINFLEWKKLIYDINKISKLNKNDIGVIKVIITRGESEFGYSSILCDKPNVIILLTKYPYVYNIYRKNGIKLISSDIPINRNIYLSKVKHLNRLEQVLIKRDIDLSNAEEAITFDSNGILIGCCSSNIFLRKKNYVYTPDISSCGIRGIMRKKVIEFLKCKTDYNFSYINSDLDLLISCDEIFVTNAIMPIFPVNTIFYKNKSFNFYSRELFNVLLSHF